MNLKEFFKPTKLKVIFTILFTFFSEIFVYQYGLRGFSVVCDIGPCVQPNYGLIFVIVYFIPLMILFYIFSSITSFIETIGILQYFKQIRTKAFLYILPFLPFLIFEKLGSTYRIGFIPRKLFFLGFDGSNWGSWYLLIKCYSYGCKYSFYFLNFFLALLFAISLFVIIFLIIQYLTEHKLRKKIKR